jgi:FkbM family methyltransferase
MVMNNHTNQHYKDKTLNVAFGLPCDGLGDTICATPTIRKVAEAYRTKIDVYSKHPDVFKNLPYVSRSLSFDEVTDNIKDSYDSYYQTEIALTHFNDQDVKFKHSHMDIRQIHANFIGFTLLKEDSHCDFVADSYEPIEGLPEKYIVIHATKSWASKDWGFEKWNSFCNQLDYPIVMVGKESSEIGSFMVEKPTYDLKPIQGFDLRNKTNIHQLWHVLNKAQLVITNDSSVMHLSGTTDTEILVLGSSQRPEIRFPYRNGSQEYKIRMVLGSCDLFCASDLRYNVIEHGTLNEVGPVVYCLEDKETFECHPSVDSVLNKVEEIVDIKSGNKLPENWLESFENVVTQEVSQYEDFFPVEDGDIVVDLGASTGVWSIPMSDKAKVVYAVEPFPNMINIIKPRIENIDNIILDTIPIGDGSETTKIFGGVVDETMVVKSQTFMDFVKKHNIEKIDFLKVDIENSEYYFLSDLDKDNYEDRLWWIKNNVRKFVVEIDCSEDWEYEQACNFFEVVLPALGGEVKCQWADGGWVPENEDTKIFTSDGVVTSKGGWRNHREFLKIMHNFVVHIDLRNTTKSRVTANNTVPIFKPSGGKLLAVGQHLSTGGSCEYMLKFLETFKDDYDEVKVVEYSNFGDTLRIHKDKIKDLVGEENVICYGHLHEPMDVWIEEHREFKNTINDYNPDTIWFNELPSGFEYKQPEKEIMDWVYRKDRPYEIICTTHNNKAFVRDERQSINTLPFYEPDKFVFCTKLHFEFSKEVDVPKELWEYPIESRVRPDRKKTLSKLDLEEYTDYYHVLQVGIVNANKNQKFSIDLSKKLIHKKIMFHFIGNDTMIENSGVSYDDFELPNIRYWGERYDVDNFMSCMDLFLFPSYRELNPLAVKQALGWGMEVFALPKNHEHEELNYTLDYLDIDNFHLLKDEDIYEYINKQEIKSSEASKTELKPNEDIRYTYNTLGKAKKESNVVLILDENQNDITDKIYSGTKYWKDYEKIYLYTM